MMNADDPILLALGSINLDLQVRADRWPGPGETLPVRDLLRTGGGKAANRAFLARRLGVRACLLGHVGDDDFGEEALRGPREVGVDVSHVQQVEGQATALAMIVVRADGGKTILLAANANEAWREGDVDAVVKIVEAAPEGSVLTVDLEVPIAVVRAAVGAAQDRGFKVLLDPSPADRMPDDLYARVDVITPNPEEARGLLGVAVESEEDAMRAGEQLVARGVGVACVKLPDGGAALVSADRREVVAPLDVDVVDETGAGDAFAGALGVALLERQELLQAVKFAAAASSLACTGYGSQAAYPDRGQLERARGGRERRR
ncbi:ribokinase [Nannocystis exedens]|uniref:Ribokinase n=1 Tax=Nannocystis exedens TaxID=54 RepID=A0A1I1VT51_9BACT|nr:ribokinase [Nannocystis exedens]PCC72810.1 ribokinase [Nannocystis exedens]SFD86004.1 ribokinase [Nannocystis exedens]